MAQGRMVAVAREEGPLPAERLAALMEALVQGAVAATLLELPVLAAAVAVCLEVAVAVAA